MPWARSLALAVAVGLPARADADPLAGKRYALDVFQGPILAAGDIIGMAGAYAGVAEGISGFGVNAASPAVRDTPNISDFSWDFAPSISIPLNLGGGARDDFDDSGVAGQAYSDFIYATVGVLFQKGVFGAGLSAEIQTYSLSASTSQSVATTVTLGRYHALVAYRLLGDQLMIGGGARVSTLSFTPHDGETGLTMIGAAPEIGFLVRPDWQSFRIGGTLRWPVHGGQPVGPAPSESGSSGGLVLPSDVVLPLELQIGAAIQVGPRPLNPKWVDPAAQEDAVHRAFALRRQSREAQMEATLAVIGDPIARELRRFELEAERRQRLAADEAEEKRLLKRLEDERRARALDWPREHLLLTADLLVTGGVAQGVSIRGFVGQNQADVASEGLAVPGSSGASVNYSPRFGVETEPVPGRMHVRAGTYYEPNRLDRPVGRQHFTFGSDVRVFSTTWFGLVSPVMYKLQAYADLAPRYQSVSLGIGVWH